MCLKPNTSPSRPISGASTAAKLKIRRDAHHMLDLASRRITSGAINCRTALYWQVKMVCEEQSDALTPVLINTLASSVNTYDDTHAEAVVHPSGRVMAPLLTLAEPETDSDK